MADSMSFDFSELDQLAADLGEVSGNAGRFVRAAVDASSLNVKGVWQEKLEGSRHVPRGPSSINYDVSVFQGFGVSVIKSEIGPDLRKPQGAIVGMLEYGTPSTPPTGFGHAALEETQADFQKGLEEALLDAEAVLRADSSISAAARAIVRGKFREGA